MSVLEQFFRVSMVLTIILIGMNASLIAFQEPLTGIPLDQPLITSDNLAGDNLENTDLSTIGSGLDSSNNLAQQDLGYDVPQILVPDFITVQEAVLGLGGGYQNALKFTFDKIAAGVEDSEEAEQVRQSGRVIRSIILALQVIGLAYIPFALWATFKGGAAP